MHFAEPDLRFRNLAARIYSLARTAPLKAPKRSSAFRSILAKHGTGTFLLASCRHTCLCRLPLASFTLSGHKLHSVQHFPSTGLSKITTFEDPLQKGFFYHPVPPPIPLSDTRSVFAISAISFLSDPPPFSESSTVLCTPYLLFHARLAHRPAHFLPLLHDVISGGLTEQALVRCD